LNSAGESREFGSLASPEGDLKGIYIYISVVSAATNGNNSETRSGRDFSDNGGIGIVPSHVPPARVTAADAGALEINFGLMPRQRHRRESFERRDDEFPIPSRRDIPGLNRGIPRAGH